MSKRPNVDAGEIRHNAMKLAMAVGDGRHYVIDSIMPRHFLQTAAKCGVSASLVQGVLDEIENDTDRAIDAAVSDLPPGFPERIVSSVIEGLRRRLRLFTHATA
jgi:serine/threonine-protein kinase HipA